MMHNKREQRRRIREIKQAPKELPLALRKVLDDIGRAAADSNKPNK